MSWACTAPAAITTIAAANEPLTYADLDPYLRLQALALVLGRHVYRAGPGVRRSRYHTKTSAAAVPDSAPPGGARARPGTPGSTPIAQHCRSRAGPTRWRDRA